MIGSVAPTDIHGAMLRELTAGNIQTKMKLLSITGIDAKGGWYYLDLGALRFFTKIFRITFKSYTRVLLLLRKNVLNSIILKNILHVPNLLTQELWTITLRILLSIRLHCETINYITELSSGPNWYELSLINKHKKWPSCLQVLALPIIQLMNLKMMKNAIKMCVCWFRKWSNLNFVKWVNLKSTLPCFYFLKLKWASVGINMH